MVSVGMLTRFAPNYQLITIVVLAGAANATSTLDTFVKGAYDLQLGHGVATYPVAGIGLTYYFN